MKILDKNVTVEEIKNDLFESKKIKFFIKREDLIHNVISGNKYRKLKYNIEEATKHYNQILSFGGSYSNHLYALSYLGSIRGMKTIGAVRGDLNTAIIKHCQSNGMKIINLDYSRYRERNNKIYINYLREQEGDFFYLPEGGTNELSVKGCEEILDKNCDCFDYICCAVGTGGTIAGILRSAKKHQKIIGFSVLKKNKNIISNILKYSNNNNFLLNNNYNFGGIGGYNDDLIMFMNNIFKNFKLKLDPIYNSKLFFGIFDLIEKNFFKKKSKILIINTGGLSGLSGFKGKSIIYV